MAARFQEDLLTEDGPQQVSEKSPRRPQTWAKPEHISVKMSPAIGGDRSKPPLLSAGQITFPFELNTHCELVVNKETVTSEMPRVTALARVPRRWMNVFEM